MRWTLFTLTIATMCAGCLTEGRTNGLLDTTEGDTDVKTDTDVSTDTILVDTTPPIDVVPVCPSSCEDGDPCTYDWCDPATGLCHHDAAPTSEAIAPPECAIDEDCDDGDPGTRDTCYHDQGGCGYQGWAYCRHEIIATLCFTTGCDDGDDCTIDTCTSDGTCSYVPDPACGIGCRRDNAVPVGEVRYYGAQNNVKVAGRLVPSYMRSCNDGPDCACEGPLALAGGGDQVQVRPRDTLPAARTWECRETGCGNVERMVTCAEPVYGAQYWMWGATEHMIEFFAPDSEDDPGGAPVQPPPSALIVDGWCLQTTVDALPGRYVVTLDLSEVSGVQTGEGEVVRYGDDTLEFIPDDACDGDNCLAMFPETVILTPGNGTVTVTTSVYFGTSALPIEGTLKSHENTLYGEFWPIGFAPGGGAEAPGVPDGDMIWPTGTLTFRRL